jgi:bacteriocin biosynthesis cyclodehydratase domain-containing protein
VEGPRAAHAGCGILPGMVLQLDAAVPLVWRTPHTVQLGGERPLVVLDGVTAAHERLLAAVAAGISPTGFAMMARAAGEDPDALLDRLAPALDRPLPSAPRVAVYGTGPLAEELVRQLGRDDDPEVVVLVGAWVLAPPEHGTWLRRDVAHLPVVVGERVTIGPLVEPGSSACLHCVQLARRDADPAWPAIAAQLHGRPAPPLSRTAVAEAAAFAVRRLHAGAAPGTSWELDPATGSVSARGWERHPECSCAAPTGSDWAPGAGRAVLPAPSSARADAVPA